MRLKEFQIPTLQDPELRLGQMAGPVVTETVISSGHQIQQQRLSMEEEVGT